jgi:hypothetical protein
MSRNSLTFPPPDKRVRPAFGSHIVPYSPSRASTAVPKRAPEVDAVSAAKIENTLDTLIGFGTRHTLAPNHLEIASWIRQQFVSFGYVDVRLHDFLCEGVGRQNVVCTKAESATGNPIVIGAHFDCRGADLAAASAPAPGANDNASGVAVMLEVARVLRNSAIATPLRFVAFSGEEQGLVGSTAYAKALHAAGESVLVMLNLDMVGHMHGSEPNIIIEEDRGNHVAANDARSEHFATILSDLALSDTHLAPRRGAIYDSDYMPFEHFGAPCVGLFDGSSDQPWYHTGKDKRHVVSAPQCVEVTRLVTAFAVAVGA